MWPCSTSRGPGMGGGLGGGLLWSSLGTLPLGKLPWAKRTPSPRSHPPLSSPHLMTRRHGDIRTCPFTLKSHLDFRTAQTTLQLTSSLCPVLPCPPWTLWSPGRSLVSVLPLISIPEWVSQGSQTLTEIRSQPQDAHLFQWSGGGGGAGVEQIPHPEVRPHPRPTQAVGPVRARPGLGPVPRLLLCPASRRWGT